ncbi:MAG: bifunctional YncE family protein/alkaline phosphatase family protein [candidate division WS1 bacterium]|jgi:YVTN family beta-propeller protein|nr:bifunctional YncE family protein/alkaline phosphatase family protein [candidate division WS1 bacterium]
MRSRMSPCLFLAAAAVLLTSSALGQELPGIRPDGATLLPNGWSLRPHGDQLALEPDLPVRMEWHPAGRYLAIQHAGYRAHRVLIFDTVENAVAATIPVPKTWSGLAWSSDGNRLYVSGGVDDVIHVFSFDPENAAAEELTALPVGDPEALDVPAGMEVAPDGTLWVVTHRGEELLAVDTETGETEAVPLPKGSMPFECRIAPDGGTIYASLWGLAEVWAVDTPTRAVRFTVGTDQHPSEMALTSDGERLFVSNANDNTVSVIDARAGAIEETISSSLYPVVPPGSTPDSICLGFEGRVLLIANADNNNCAVIDVSSRGKARSLGFIPVGCYPTSVRISPEGRVFVANGKGSVGSSPNAEVADDFLVSEGNLGIAEYIGGLYRGSISVFDFPSPVDMARLSATAYQCSPLQPAAAVRETSLRPDDSPIPATVGDPSPIRHCVYIVKENRTYDQVLGDDPRGNGDPRLCIFGREVTPNHHALAEEFVLLDNFYVESEVSADGHEWTMGAYATDFVERTWPVTYGGRGTGRSPEGRSMGLGYPSEGNFDIATPKGGYLWDRCREAGVSYRSYGEFINNGRTPEDPGTTDVEALQDHFDPFFRSYDLSYPDVDRAARFLEELARFEAEGEMPQFIVIRLPNDHTSGTAPGAPTPRAMVADNDLALGQVIEGLSRSSFWPTMAIFVVEDDAQNGPDHVDAHRSIAFVASPYVRRGAVVSDMLSTSGILRTMELILGLSPMSQFDAAARPLYSCFMGEPDLTPYVCKPATWPLDEINTADAWGSQRSLELDLAREDAADDLLFNEIIWKSVMGADSPMPMPRRAAFVRIVND